MEQKLLDKVAVITGGSSGIGLATAKLFAAHGARLVLAGRNHDALLAATAMLDAESLAVTTDVSRPAEVSRLMAAAAHRFGGIDVLFANAGTSKCPDILATDEHFFDELLGSNLKGVFFAFTSALPHMKENAAAIFTSSAVQQRGRPGDALYAASKAAVRSLARTLSVDPHVVRKNIRVNVVSPGAVRTPLTAVAVDDAATSAWIASQVPLRRWGEPEEIARAVLFLASSDSSYVTGTELAVDGGLAQV